MQCGIASPAGKAGLKRPPTSTVLGQLTEFTLLSNLACQAGVGEEVAFRICDSGLKYLSTDLLPNDAL